MERYSKLLSRLEKFEHEIDSLDNDGLLSQSSTRTRDDVSVTTHTTARRPTSRRCSPSMNEIPEASNPEPSSFSNKTPPLPPRPEKPTLSECHRTEPMLSTFLNGNNDNHLTIGMSTSSSFRSINNNTADSKTEAKYSDKKLAKPETTVAKTSDRFGLSDTTLSAVDHFRVNHQQPKTNNDSIPPLYASTQNKFQNHFAQENLNNHFYSKYIFSEFSRDSPRNCFRCKRFNQWAWVVPNTKKPIIPT